MLALPGKIVHPRFARFREYRIELEQAGQGVWSAFRALGFSLEEVLAIAKGWGRALSGIEKPWLCWNVEHEWCLVQQKLVTEAGWTPLVGFDPRVGPPRKTVSGAVVFDFNAELGLPLLYPHFPLEFAFLFARRLAFWHSDLLLRREKMAELARIFAALPDSVTAACEVDPGFRYRYLPWRQRYWELVGCTTASASRDQFEKGCGWWMAFWAHPHQSHPKTIRRWRYWDHGAGIRHWHRHEGGHCMVLDGRDYEEGHFSKIGRLDYQGVKEPNGSDVRRNMSEELVRHYDLRTACGKLGLADLLDHGDQGRIFHLGSTPPRG
ncbi:hypothetical protein FHS83_000044 [Rhizomicrobium palustre]|uniref:Uncharacterized protein n=1 Tax=Rhizomicrobium palustre TaxID=189966 RepID=A0A846MTN8_9PROT|nr:hypothetical protein [Rhizomicrobium palustre]NIK86726.1 hypothetical protein [Rhizomicrobium palustre]